MQAERTVAATTETPKPLTPQAFLDSVSLPMQAWLAAEKAIEQLNKQYFSKGGPNYETICKLATEAGTLAAKLEIRGVPASPAEIENRIDGIRTDMLDYVSEGKYPPGSSNRRYSTSLETTRVPHMRPLEKERLIGITAAAGDLQRQYGQQYSDVFGQWIEQGELVVGPFKQYITQRYNNFPEFCQYLQENPNRAETFLRLANNSLLGQIKKIVDQIRFNEETSPTAQTVEKFLEKLGKDYYTRDQKDKLWAGISLMLPGTLEQTRQAFTTGTEEERLQLINPIVCAILEKGIPPSLKAAYSGYLLMTTSTTWRQFEQLLDDANISKPTEADYARRGFTWEAHKKRKSGGNGNGNGNGNGEKPLEETVTLVEAPKPQAKTVIIGKTACQNESEIEAALKLFMQDKKVHQYCGDDLTIYAMAIAKMAGMRANCVPHKLEKMTAVPPATASNGEKSPVQILRRVSKDPPRIIFAQLKDYIVVMDAFDRTDNNYRGKISKDFVFQIQLPS